MEGCLEVMVFRVRGELWLGLEMSGNGRVHVFDGARAQRCTYEFELGGDALREACRLLVAGGGSPVGWVRRTLEEAGPMAVAR